MTEESFLRLSRGFFENPLWTERREYSRAEAWLDLIQAAAWESRKRLVKGTIVEEPRGGIVASERFLSDRWQWSRTKVRAFLDLLEEENMIGREKDRENSVIFLCNFEKYNPVKDRRKATGEPAENQIEEGKKDPPRATPSLPQTLEFAPMAGVAPDVAEVWWNDCESRPLSQSGRYTDKSGCEIWRWQNSLTSFGRRWVSNEERKTNGQKNGAPKKPVRLTL